jgi:hypothetical protein
MKKILITRRLLKASEEKASKNFDVNINTNDENKISGEFTHKMSFAVWGKLEVLGCWAKGWKPNMKV